MANKFPLKYECTEFIVKKLKKMAAASIFRRTVKKNIW